MANETSSTLSQATDTITQIIRSIQDYPENELIIIINTILQSILQAIAQLGTKLPKELQWCKNIPSPPTSDHTINSTVGNTTHATANNALQQLSAADYATPDHLAVDNTTQHSVADDTIQEPTAVSSLKEAHPIKKSTPVQRQERKDKYQVIEEEFIKQSKSFPCWMKNPESFWKSAEELNIKGEKDASRFRDFIQHALALEGDADVPKFQRRFNSIVAFRMFRYYMPKAHATQDSTKKFLGLIGAVGDDIDSCQELLVGGRRRQEFCQRLSESNSETNYGPLFLKVKDKIWTKPREKHWRTQFTKTLQALEERKFMKLPTMRVANTVAQEVIDARLGTIGCQLKEYRIKLDEEKTDETRSGEEEDNNTTVSEHVRTDLDGRRSPKRARLEVDLDVDCTRASKRPFTGPSATASETSAVVSGVNTLQLNNGGELSHGFQNMASQAQGGDEHWQAPNTPYAHYDIDVSYSGVHPYFELPPTDIMFDGLLAAAIEEMRQD